MKFIEWDSEKNEWLKKERAVCFEDVITAIEEGDLLETRAHPNQDKYSGQKQFIILINNYVHIAPFVENKERLFLKTLFRSRVENEKYFNDK